MSLVTKQNIENGICELEELIKRIPTKMLSVKFAMRVWEVDMYSSAAGAPGGVT